MQGGNESSAEPSTEDLQTWVETYGLTHPVVNDFNYTNAFYGNGYLPSMATLGVGAVIIETGNAYDTATIEEYLPGSDEDQGVVGGE